MQYDSGMAARQRDGGTSMASAKQVKKKPDSLRLQMLDAQSERDWQCIFVEIVGLNDAGRLRGDEVYHFASCPFMDLVVALRKKVKPEDENRFCRAMDAGIHERMNQAESIDDLKGIMADLITAHKNDHLRPGVRRRFEALCLKLNAVGVRDSFWQRQEEVDSRMGKLTPVPAFMRNGHNKPAPHKRPPMRPGKTMRDGDRAKIEARKKANRAARLAQQPPKGNTGGKKEEAAGGKKGKRK